MVPGPDGTGPLDLSSAARDLWTRVDGGAAELGRASARAWLDAQRRLVRLETDPIAAGIRPLEQLIVGKGFRAAVDRALPVDGAERTLLYRLAQELPVAALISGYVMLYRRRPSGSTSTEAPAHGVPVDICSGWRRDGVMMRSLAATGEIPVPIGPPAPPLDADDPSGWHAMAPLAPNAMRRRRLIDVSAGATPDRLRVFAMFRDTYVEPDGLETVLHQYELAATMDRASHTILACAAVPNVLPFPECPAAAASASRLVGQRIDELPGVVREDFRGTTTCTHLNDLLTVLGDAGALADALTARSAAG